MIINNYSNRDASILDVNSNAFLAIVFSSAVLLLLFSCDHPSGNGQVMSNKHEMTRILQELEDQWSVECADQWASSSRVGPENKPAFRKIIALGPSILPLLVERIRRCHFPSTGIDFNPNKYDPSLLPWVRVVEEITGHRLKDDPKYREKVLARYKEIIPVGEMPLDPKGEDYIPEVAIPYILEWWENTGSHTYNK